MFPIPSSATSKRGWRRILEGDSLGLCVDANEIVVAFVAWYWGGFAWREQCCAQRDGFRVGFLCFYAGFNFDGARQGPS